MGVEGEGGPRQPFFVEDPQVAVQSRTDSVVRAAMARWLNNNIRDPMWVKVRLALWSVPVQCRIGYPAQATCRQQRQHHVYAMQSYA